MNTPHRAIIATWVGFFYGVIMALLGWLGYFSDFPLGILLPFPGPLLMILALYWLPPRYTSTEKETPQ